MSNSYLLSRVYGGLSNEEGSIYCDFEVVAYLQAYWKFEIRRQAYIVICAMGTFGIRNIITSTPTIIAYHEKFRRTLLRSTSILKFYREASIHNSLVQEAKSTFPVRFRQLNRPVEASQLF